MQNLTKLEELKKKIEEIQAKNLFKEDMKAFITLVLKTVVEAKNEVRTLTSENLNKIQNALDYITAEHEKMSANVSRETEMVKNAKMEMSKEMAKSIMEMKQMCEDMMMTMPEDGKDGKDADEEKITQDVLSKIKFPEEINREKIVAKINEGKGKDTKINATQITGLPEFTREVIREVGTVGAVESPLKDAVTGNLLSKDASGAWLVSQETGVPSLTSTYIGYGSGANQLTGSPTLTWDNASSLLTVTGNLTVAGILDTTNARLYDLNTGARSVQWNNRYLTDSGGTNALAWDSRNLLNAGAAPILDWSSTNIKLVDTVSSIGAILNTGTLATSDKTFTFPNTSGTFALAGVGGVWTVSGNDIYNSNSGNVGINTASPLAKLHVTGDFQVDGLSSSSLYFSDGAMIFTPPNNAGSNALTINMTGAAATGNPISITANSNVANHAGIYVAVTGTTGIGLDVPTAKRGARLFGTLADLQLVSGKVSSTVADGASAVAYSFNTTNALTTTAKLINLKNNGTEEFAVQQDGAIMVGQFDTRDNATVRVAYARSGSDNTTFGWASFGSLGTPSGIHNSVFGYSAGNTISTGNDNTLFGYQAGGVITTNSGNTVIGASALVNAVVGADNNTAMGLSAGHENTIGYDNVYFGLQAGYWNQTGARNLYIGRNAGLQSLGSYNVAIGYQAGRLSAATISYSIALGVEAIYTADHQFVLGGGHDDGGGGIGQITDGYFGSGVTDTTPYDFTFHGTGGSGTNIAGANLKYSSGIATGNATTGGDHIWYTSDAGASGTTAQTPSEKMRLNKLGNLKLIASVGASAGGIIYKGSDRFISDFSYGNNGVTTPDGFNTWVGIQAGNLTTGSTATSVWHSSYMVGIGYQALSSNTTGWSNIGIGYQALKLNTTGTDNIAIGYTALAANTTASQSIAIGSYVLPVSTGALNVGIGYQALQSATSAIYNVALGAQALQSTLTGGDNLAMGHLALGTATSAGGVAVGSYALGSITSGGFNVGIGYAAGYYYGAGVSANQTSAYSIYIGYQARASADGNTNEIVMGKDTVGNGSNTVTIGNTSNLRTYLTGVNLKAGTATAGTAPLKFATGTLLTTPEAGAMEFLAEKFYLTPTSTAIAAIPGVLFTQTNTVTVANTVTETALTGTGVGSLTLPANFFVAGKTLRLRMWGYHSSTANPTITAKIKLGSTVIGTMTGSSGNGSNDTFIVWGDITCRTTGAAGTVFTQGEYNEIHSSGLKIGTKNTATNTIDTTASQAVSITIQWGTADVGNTISATNFTLEVLN